MIPYMKSNVLDILTIHNVSPPTSHYVVLPQCVLRVDGEFLDANIPMGLDSHKIHCIGYGEPFTPRNENISCKQGDG